MKKIVIMGATSGIGEHVAESLAATGWRVGVAGRKVDRMKALKEMFPDSIEWEAIDITKSEAPRKLLSLIRKNRRYGHLFPCGWNRILLTRSSIYSGKWPRQRPMW